MHCSPKTSMKPQYEEAVDSYCDCIKEKRTDKRRSRKETSKSVKRMKKLGKLKGKGE